MSPKNSTSPARRSSDGVGGACLRGGFVFPDGKRRVGFLLSSVERFFAAHSQTVTESTNLSQVSDEERERSFFAAHDGWPDIATAASMRSPAASRAMNRSPLTILHTVRKHDEENPDAGDLPDSRRCNRRCRMRERFFARLGQDDINRRRWRSSCAGRKQAIYRVVMNDRIARLTARKIKFIDDPLYHEPDADASINEIVAAERVAGITERRRLPRSARSAAVFARISIARRF